MSSELREEKIAFLDSFSEEEWLLNGHKKSDLESLLAIYNSLLAFLRPGRYLELGCGTGLLVQFIVRFSGMEIDPYGVDGSPRAFNILKTLNETYPDHFALSDYFKNTVFGDLDFSTIFFFVSKGVDAETILSVMASASSASTDPSFLLFFYDESMAEVKNELLDHFEGAGKGEFLVSDFGPYFIHLLRRPKATPEA